MENLDEHFLQAGFVISLKEEFNYNQSCHTEQVKVEHQPSLLEAEMHHQSADEVRVSPASESGLRIGWFPPGSL